MYYDDEAAYERLIVQALAPLVREFDEAGATDSFFFIRYNEGGPHLRVRFRSNSAQETARAAAAHFERFISLNPSSEGRGRGFFGDPVPNHTVVDFPYIPELDRYGGKAGVSVAEEHFEASSRMVLKMLSRVPDHALGPGVRLSIGFSLVAGLVLSAGFSGDSGAAFVRDAISHIRTADFSEETVDQYYREHGGAFERTLTALETFSDVRSRTPDAAPGASALLMAQWAASTGTSCDRLRDALRANPAYCTPHPALDCSAKYALVIQSYIHMTLNRVGLWAARERFVLEILSRAFEAAP